jgi:hypothetical protein
VQRQRWVAAIKFAVRLFSDKIYSVGFNFNSLIINGKTRVINNGVTRLSRKGTIVRNGNKITFSTNEGEEVDFITFGSFFNAYVRTNVRHVKGVCAQQFLRSHSFRTEHRGKIVKIRRKLCPKKMVYSQRCRRNGLHGMALKNCVSDLCNGLKRSVEKKILKRNRREKHKKLKIIFKRHRHKRARPHRPHRHNRASVFKRRHRAHRRVHTPRIHVRPNPPRRPTPPARPVRVFRRRFFPTRRVFRRRGRGDVWLQTKGGKWLDLDVDGTFKYLRDNKVGLKVDLQFTSLGKGSVISAVAIQAKGKKIVAERDGKVSVNGEPIKLNGAIFDFEKNQFQQFQHKKNEYEIRGLTEDRLTFKYEEDSQSYMVVVGSLEPHHVGLFANPENPEKYQVTEKKSLFIQYVPFKKLAKKVPTKEELVAAGKCCDKLKGEKVKECKSDFIRTGECLQHYFDKDPKLTHKKN